jgi:hypothetical protein
VADETIRTSISRVIQDQSAPVGVRELALEVLHWRLRERFVSREWDDTRDVTTEV